MKSFPNNYKRRHKTITANGVDVEIILLSHRTKEEYHVNMIHPDNKYSVNYSTQYLDDAHKLFSSLDKDVVEEYVEHCNELLFNSND